MPKAPPYPFVLDALIELDLTIRAFFGGFGIYHHEKILMILYAKEKAGADKGVWLATDRTHHESLRKEIPSLASITVLGNGATNWQVIPEFSDDFERDVLTACELILQGDARIGRIPKKKKSRKK